MKVRSRFGLVVSAVFVLTFFSHAVADELQLADTIELKSGTQLTGKIITQKEENGRDYIVFKTANGGVLKLDARRLVKRVYEVDPQYQEVLAKMDDLSPDEHWKMYGWLKNQDNPSTLKREMEHHLTRIVELDNTDEKAVRLLDNERFDGKVRHRDHQFESHGYRKVTGGWIPKLHVENMGFEQEREELMAKRRSAFKLWQRQLKTGKQSVDYLQKAAEQAL